MFGIVFLGAGASLLSLLRVSKTPREQAATAPQREHAWTGIVGRNGGLAVLAAGLLVVLHLSGQLDPRLSVGVAVGASLALMVTARSILPAGTLTLRGTPQRLIVLRAILGATVTTTDLYLTFYLQAERGYSPTTAGLVIAIAAAGLGPGCMVQGRFPSTLRSHRQLILVATILVITGPATVLAYTVIDVPLWVVVIAGVLMGTGMGTAYPRLSSATLALANPDEQGAYSSALQTGESMGIGVVTALTAAVVIGGGTFTTVYTILIGLASVAIAIACLANRTRSADAT